MAASVAFSRAAPSLADLTIPDAPFADALWLAEVGMGAVGWDYRRSYAPDSDWQSGKALLAVVRDAATLPLTIYAHAETAMALQAVKAELEAAASQWAYTVTVTVDGVATVYNCEPAIPQWGPVDSGMVQGRMDRCQLVIPVNP